MLVAKRLKGILMQFSLHLVIPSIATANNEQLLSMKVTAQQLDKSSHWIIQSHVI